jgi:hypothetical protein
MKPDEVRAIRDLYSSLEDRVIALMRALSPQGPDRLSGPDSPWTNPWLEYAAQIQYEPSFYFSLYVKLVETECEGQVAALSPIERGLLWLDSEHYWGTGPEDSRPADSEIRDAVASELKRRVDSRAADLDLPFERDRN